MKQIKLKKLSLAWHHLLSCFSFSFLFFRKYWFRVLIASSIWFSVILGGKVNQTFSTRNWQRKKEDKFNIVWIIDLILGDGHCMESWIKWRTKIK